MSGVNIFWNPNGFELDSLGSKRFIRIADGDTPYISMAIRMLGIDTPEKNYSGKPSKYDQRLSELAVWIQSGAAPIDDGLAHYLYPKLATGRAGSLQEDQGNKASEELQRLIDEKLTLPSGKKRQVFLQAADEPFDSYGRLLAYIAPKYSQKELAGMSLEDRATFNLLMVQSGWAASFPIYPSLPKQRDLVLFYNSARKAVEERLGPWADQNMLAGYEFRMCVKLYDVTKKLVGGQNLSAGQRYGWISRYCADMSARTIAYPQQYYRIKPFDRLFIWPQDVTAAVANLNLLPAE